MNYEKIEEFGLVIIESLRENDKKTGTLLHNELLKYKKFQEPNFSSFLYVVKNKEELFQTLDGIIDKIKINTLFPILHLEMHGFEDGIQLSSNEIVVWDELLTKFREINILLLNSLTIMMSMCKGITLAFDIDTSNRAPVGLIIGTIRNISEIELLKGYEVFYNNYFFSFDPVKSMELMNNEIDINRPSFYYLKAEYWFDMVIDYDKTSRYSIIEKERYNELKDKSKEEIRIYIEKEIRTIFGDDNKDYFLMSDLINDE